MRLADLIAELEPLDQTLPVLYPNGTSPGPPCSWRGIYADLTFPPTSETRTVADVLTDAKAAIGATFAGHHGGSYTMGPPPASGLTLAAPPTNTASTVSNFTTADATSPSSPPAPATPDGLHGGPRQPHP